MLTYRRLGPEDSETIHSVLIHFTTRTRNMAQHFNLEIDLIHY